MGGSARLAGVAVPLSALRRERDDGIGEFPDVVALAEWGVEHGQRIVALLPLGECPPGEASPYSALSTFALEPLYVSPADLPELADLAGDPAAFPSARNELLDREAVHARKEPLFERAFAAFENLPPDAERRRESEAFCRRTASWLDDYALFRALAEEHGGSDWRLWPEEVRERRAEALAEAGQRLAPRLAFFRWLQFAADAQWREARERLRALGVLVYGDLPFAPGVQSADVWAERDAFDLTRSTGAPPDDFSATGQNWGLPKLDWQAQRASDWRWLRRRARRMAELYDLIRVDHVVGLFRTWSFDDQGEGAFDPAEEPAQRAQGREILEVMRAEIAPARLVAEDLGVIPDFVRETMLDLDVPGYKIFRWVPSEDGDSWCDAAEYPACALATTGTHDTETLASWWRDAEPSDRALAGRFLGREGETLPQALDDDLRLRFLERLYASPARYVILPIQDLLGWDGRINVPATIGGENWRWRLPVPIERLPRDPRIAARVRAAGR